MVEVLVLGFQKYWRQKLALLKSQCHAITNKYPEAVVQQLYKVLNDIEILAGCILAKVGESSKWTSTVNSTEEKRAIFLRRSM
jgi:hypothetical protein